MLRKKTKLIKNRVIKINFFMIMVFIILGLIILFSATNLIAIIELRKQVELILNDTTTVYHLKSDATVAANNSESTGVIDTSVVTTPITSPGTSNFTDSTDISVPVNSASSSETTNFNDVTKSYSNFTAEPFFNSLLIDSAKTNMRLDDVATAMTFLPVYTFKKEQNCSDLFCGFLSDQDLSLNEVDNKLYYKDQEVKLPSELDGKKITSLNFNLLTTKWIVGIVISENNQDVGYAYLFDGKTFEPLITTQTTSQIKSRYPGGSISAGGSDTQFIILYSGYEGIGYLYNNGTWQNLSQYFGLRVTKGGFKARILRGGSGSQANWYVCSDTIGKPKFIKLWQNNTNSIQGSIDLSSILDVGTDICSLKGNREVSIARNTAGIGNSLYNFIDQGFDNSHNYTYQSADLSRFTGKAITSVQLQSRAINAPTDLYSLAVSTDLTNWQPNTDWSFNFTSSTSSSFYVKINFKNRESDYSPWFGGMDVIYYTAKDINK